MSAMMAQSAPGPIPITAQPQFNAAVNPIMRGHARQPSSATRPVTQHGTDASFAGRTTVLQNPYANTTQTMQADGGKPRIIPNPSAAQQPRSGGPGSSSGGPRPTQATTGAQRPTTSHGAGPGQQPSVGGAASQQGGQQQSNARGPTASRQTEPAQPPPLNTNGQTSGSGNRPPTGSGTTTTGQTSTTNSFPHAFERWEMLSSRWEGLTGYWISRLEGNRHELSGLPLEQEMSRQITDLSAAGANLFHALIELQRLRASSERKFQRWFFETRADQERAREASAQLERTLQKERQGRAELLAEIEQLKIDKAKAEKLAQETQRELQISKDECRRAWEELGRREDIERERTRSLREGHPTLINGVQVTPMPMPGIPSRSNSTATRPRVATSAFVPSTQTEAYSGRPDSQTLPDPAEKPRNQRGQQQPTAHHEQAQEHSQRPGAGSTGSATPTDFYNPPELKDPNAPASDVSYNTNPVAPSPAPSGLTGVSEAFEVDEEGNIVLDEHGAPRYQSRRGEDEHESQWGAYPYPDYEGSAYGDEGGQPGGGYESGGVGIGAWESRHHHPTRLSDVLEEDERLTNSDGRSALGP